MVHGLAASIRSAKENEVFDLGGQSASTIEATVQAAFAEPFDLQDMIRITLVTGAGKQARQKYDENAHKAVVTALQQAGYAEDRTASGVVECAGLYKLQHDTGKNLKTVVVYPRIASKTRDHKGKAGESEEALIPEDTPGYKLAVASMPTFSNILKSKCPSWSQKKGCLECLEALDDIIKSLDDKLMKGQPLADTEQSFYDVVSQLEEKKALVRHESKQQVENGQITEFEKILLLDHNAQRLKEDPKNTKLSERKQLLKSIDPITPRQLKHHAEIAKLHKEASKLMHLNENQLLSVKERQLVTRREQIWQEIADLENASRGWFEDDEIFEARLQASRQEMTAKYKSPNDKGGKSGSGRLGTSGSAAADGKLTAPKKGSSSGSKWILPTEQKGGKKKKGGRPTGSDVFGAMRKKQGDDNSSGSDEDDDAEADETVEKPETQEHSSKDSELVANAAKTASSGQSKSKKKKKKKKNAGKSTESEDALLTAATREAAVKEENKDETILGQLWVFLNTYVFPLFLALIAWLIRLFFGKPKKKDKRS